MHTDFLNEFKKSKLTMVSETQAKNLLDEAKFKWDRNGYAIFRKMYDATVKQYKKDIWGGEGEIIEFMRI